MQRPRFTIRKLLIFVALAAALLALWRYEGPRDRHHLRPGRRVVIVDGPVRVMVLPADEPANTLQGVISPAKGVTPTVVRAGAPATVRWDVGWYRTSFKVLGDGDRIVVVEFSDGDLKGTRAVVRRKYLLPR